jgi:predicted enzyme related to lactoylglutathione lyase
MSASKESMNQHPAVMFEIMADDQSKLTDFYTTGFGWQVDPDSAGFNLVPFAPQTRALLGGLGQAQPSVPGYEKGITFYFEVEDLETKLDLVLQNGGNQVGDITTLDGYTFVNFTDPEDNLIGMIKPFSS